MPSLGTVDKSPEAEPVFAQIADLLRAAIRSQMFAPGQKIPSESELMAHFGVARMTVREALAVLKGEGLLVAEHGRGVFVRSQPVVRRIASDRFARAHRQAGKAAFIAESEGVGKPSVDQVQVSREKPAVDVRVELGLRPHASVVARRRRYLLDGTPVEIADSFIPLTIAKGTLIEQENPGPGGIYARIEEVGHRLTEFKEEVSARMPTPEERQRLALASGVPVLVVRRVAFSGDVAVEVIDTVKSANHYLLEYRFPAV